MTLKRRDDPTDRLEAHLAAHHPPLVSHLLKRRVAHWQRYAVVTGSAIAMATNGSADIRDLATLSTPLINAAFLASEGAAATPRSQSAQPAIGGIFPAYGSANVIQPGEWVTIYGYNLASGTAVWKGDFPTSLGGTRVEINGKPAFLSFVSTSQINLQAPDDTALGAVSVVVTTNSGMATSSVTLSQYSPSFLLTDSPYVAAIILRPDGSGAYANGGYDILGPTGNCFGYYTTAAKPGDILEIFGVGFGPTTPTVHAGTPFSGNAPINGALSLSINK